MLYFIVLVVSLVLCSPGFKKYVYFFSVGYGFAVAGIGACLMILFKDALTWGTAAACILFLVYGLRLGGYLLLRELRSKAYHEFLDGEVKANSTVPMFVQVSIWLACGILYFLQTSPVLFRLMNGGGTDAAVVVGLVFMAFISPHVRNCAQAASAARLSRRLLTTTATPRSGSLTKVRLKRATTPSSVSGDADSI